MMASLGERIRARRTELGWTQDVLATKVGISKGFLSDLENAKRKVSAENLMGIAEVLNLSLDFLMKGDDTPVLSEEIQIPSALSAFASLEGLSFKQTLTLLRMRQQIVAHRSAGTRSATDDFDWRKLYESVKEFLHD
jgi:transcriptional regulator with XRE-family HTH domain